MRPAASPPFPSWGTPTQCGIAASDSSKYDPVRKNFQPTARQPLPTGAFLEFQRQLSGERNGGSGLRAQPVDATPTILTDKSLKPMAFLRRRFSDDPRSYKQE
jgi:hypothetical protein